MKKILWFIPVLGLAAQFAMAADDGGKKGSDPSASASGSGAGTAKNYIPPVMRNDEPKDTVMVLLPGPAPEPPAPPAIAVKTVVPAPVVAPVPAPAAFAEVPKLPEAAAAGDEAEAGPRPYYRRAPKAYPEDFEKDTLRYLQDRIGKWTADDVADMLGSATRQRPAFGEDQKENGSIFAFTDPTNKFREFELDFDGNTGMMRTVFAYPIQMTWQECRKQFGAKVTATDASKGRKFYSYADRRLDVLVGPDGRVVSLGLY